MGSAEKRAKLIALRKRDGDLCHLCGEAMDFETRTSPLSASLDHVRPKYEGGTNCLTNLKLAHRCCNEWRRHLPVELARRWARRLRARGIWPKSNWHLTGEGW
jgi:hypothetical protein